MARNGMIQVHPELQQFKADIDDWIKDLHGKVSSLTPLSGKLEENTDNITHNYELILDMRDELKKLREEVSALRMIQILHLRGEVQKKV